jgi:hypothetical protein
MSQSDKVADSSVDESLPSMALPRADTLPEMSDAQVHDLGKMQVNDGDFETKAVVNGGFSRCCLRTDLMGFNR